MNWPKPEYSKKQVNKAGDILCNYKRTYEEYLWATKVLNNWRSIHGYPVNTFQATLRDKCKAINASNALIAQRLKRTPSIINKLKRFDSMQLARMQDIGGLRAVVDTPEKVRELRNSYDKSLGRNSFKHEFVGEDDYISYPKDSGYRSLHLVYRYRNDKVTDYNGLLLELQIRTQLQHTWATAVETMGTFLDHALKASEGPEEWLNFFSLAGSAFAHLENATPVPGYEKLSKTETFEKVEAEAVRLDVRQRLNAFAVVANAISNDKQKGSYHLIVLNTEKKQVSIWSYVKDRLEEANLRYTEEEGRIAQREPIQVVLVATGSIENLQRAYPNYFLDTREFVMKLNEMRDRKR